nr:zinc finger, CCHC-type [Tanacetum cinerariifolium]
MIVAQQANDVADEGAIGVDVDAVPVIDEPAIPSPIPTTQLPPPSQELPSSSQIEQDEAYVKELKAELNKNINWDDVTEQVQRKEKEENVVLRLKNRWKKRTTKRFKKIESSEEKAVKKQKLDEEVEELKKHLQIVSNNDDNVYTEATPLALKVPVVDYEIYTKNNKPYFKIIRADRTHQLFLSFLSLLRNFDREDLEVQWQLVKERFASSKPKNFLDDFLPTTLTNMFEKFDVQAQVWKNQRSVHCLAKVKSWRLLESYGVHIITFTTTQMILLVERRYPLTRAELSLVAKEDALSSYHPESYIGHMKKDYRSHKGNDGAGLNRSKDPEKQQGYNYDNFVNVLHYVSVIFDAFYVKDDEVAWLVDSGATSHVCRDLYWFQVCKSIEEGSFVKMGNVATKPIKGIGHVLFNFTSVKTLCLDNVLYVPGIQKNIVSKIVLNKYGYKQVLESDKFYVIEPNDYVLVNSIIELRDAIFDEERFTSISRPRGMIQPSFHKIAEDEVEGTDDVPGPSVPRKGNRTRKAKSFGSDFQLYLVEGTRDKTLSQREYCFIIEGDLRTLTIDDLVIHQMDVKTTFLNGDLDEEIYMKQPGGFMMRRHESKCVYRKFDASGKGVIICLYVDDMLIFVTEQDQVNKTKEFLSSKFDMKDLGEAEVILESEFMALAVAGNEAQWLRNLVYGIPLWPKPISTISIRCDSAATLAKAYSQVYNAGSLTKGLARDLVRKTAIGICLKST